MKILLAAVNAKYIHTCPAVYSLKAYADAQHIPGVQIDLCEYTINDRYGDVLSGILSGKPDIIGFSTYIWNAPRIRRLIRDIRKICGTQIRLWAGGPEAGSCPQPFLSDGADLCMLGEGEIVFSTLARVYAGSVFVGAETLKTIPGLAFTENEKLFTTGMAVPADLNTIPFPYPDLSRFSHRILYYEASRGCPFSCAYCLSGNERGVRFRRADLIEKELQLFLDHRVAQVKFTDRTFNADEAYALRIWQYIMDHDNGVTNFHFEAEGSCFTEKQLALLSRMRPGLVQLEIGIQSANPETLRSVRRSPRLDRIQEAVRILSAKQNINLHLDLIAGLPYEDLSSFRNSFNVVFSMNPHQLQLGFLKLLKGTLLDSRSEEYGLAASQDPPYEILKTRWLSFEDLDTLHRISDRVEDFVNSQGFRRSLPSVVQLFPDPYTMFLRLSEFFRKKGCDGRTPSAAARYTILTDFVRADFSDKRKLSAKETDRIEDLIRFDCALHVHASRRMTEEITFLSLEDRPVRCRFDYRRCSPVHKEAAFTVLTDGYSGGLQSWDDVTD